MSTRPRYCSYNACKNNTSMKDVHFYRFPKDEQRCKAWVKACKNEKLLSIPVKDLYMKKVLCMNHFEDWCFMNITKKHRLVHNAIPNTKKFLVTRNPVQNNLTNIPVSNNLGHLNDTPVSNNVGCKNSTSVSNVSRLNNTPVSNNIVCKNNSPVSNNVDCLSNTPVSNNVGRKNDIPVSNGVDRQNNTPVSNNVDCQSSILEQLLTTSGTVSKTLKMNNPLAPKNAQIIQVTAASSNTDKVLEQESEVVNESLLEQGKSNLSKDKQNDSSKNKVVKEVYKEAQFKNNVQDCKKKPTTIPTTFNVPNRPLIPSSGQQGRSYAKPGSLVLKTLKMNNPLAPKNAQLIQVTAATSNNDKAVEQESEVVNESLLEQRKGNLSKVKKNDSSNNKEIVKEKWDSPSTQVMTYLICDVDQELTDFEKMLPIFQDNNAMDFTQNIQIRDASNNSNIMQDISLMSKVAEMESKVEKQYLEDKKNMLLKISNLEREIEGFRKRHKKDQRKIQNLLQLQHQKDRKIATLKKCITNLRQRNIACKNQDNQIYVFFKQPNISKQ